MDSMQDHADLADAIQWIDPVRLDYQDWLNVGMGLHESGLGVEVWDAWSQKDPARYHPGECERKWAGFGRVTGDRVKSGSVIRMAEEAGWTQSTDDVALDWGDLMSFDTGPRAARPDAAWAAEEDPTVKAPAAAIGGAGASARLSDERPQMQMLADYLEALFGDEDYVAYSTESFQPEGSDRKVPTRGVYTRTAGELRQALAKWMAKPDPEDRLMENVVGTYDADTGAWIRFNPFDGKGVRNDNVTEYRYALVESDELPYEKQLPLIRDMNLPCAAIVTSGHKSVHAIVKVDAGGDYALYRKRTEELYAYCRKCGFSPDTQNKNPSRLSRMPGIIRGDQIQALVDTNTGAENWEAWCAWRIENEDDLPDDVVGDWDEPIELAPALIGTEEAGILRRGQKMVLAGPSKAGKSYALIDLAEAICCGGDWWGYPCAEGPVYYINLEIADASFRDRQHKVWEDREAHGQTGSGKAAMVANFHRWDLRGHACDMERLAPRIIHRVLKRSGGERGRFAAIIVDPIYKVNGGDENDASAISRFTNQLDRIAAECGCAVIYAHHHAKGALGDRKSMDRMSGSGVFARDADAIVDMSQLEIEEGSDIHRAMEGATGWRVSATLREFRSPEPIDLIWRYPRFFRDASGMLKRCEEEGRANPLRKVNRARKKSASAYHADIVAAIGRAVDAARAEGAAPTREEVMGRMNADSQWTGDEVTSTKITSWTQAKSKWSPWRVSGADDGFVLYDTRSADPFGAGAGNEYAIDFDSLPEDQ